MLICFLQASKEIFACRNSKSSLSKGQIDIHGLHVAEMIACMDEMIPYFRSSSTRNKVIRVITGSGHHSSGPQKGEARLLPALTEYCATNGFDFDYILDPNRIQCGVMIRNSFN